MSGLTVEDVAPGDKLHAFSVTSCHISLMRRSLSEHIIVGESATYTPWVCSGGQELLGAYGFVGTQRIDGQRIKGACACI